MSGSGRLSSLLAIALLLCSSTAAAAAGSLPPGNSSFSFALGQGQREHQFIEAYSNTTVAYRARSTIAVSVALMTPSEFRDLKAGNGSISESLADGNGTNIQEDVHVEAGSYYIVVLAYAGRATGAVYYALYPNDPLETGPLSPPEPTGIASFGLSNQSGAILPYAVNSTDVVGLASVSALEAYNASGWSDQSNPSGTTLQLNTILVVNEADGKSQVYWCQNTPDFVTASSVVAMSDNLWNFSTTGVLSNASVTSQGDEGTVSTYQQNGTQYYYNYEGDNATYTLPLGMAVMINATTEPGTGVLVQFGERSTGGGHDASVGGWFDNVTIHDSGAKSAYFLTDGNATTPAGLFYDTELVWAGENNGESTNFTQMNSTLGLFYANGDSSTLSPFPSYFSFGYDIAEGADNLKMSYLGNGEARAATGTPSYAYLGAASGTYPSLAVEASLGFPGVRVTTTTTGTTSSSTTSQTSSVSTVATTSTTSQATSSTTSIVTSTTASSGGTASASSSSRTTGSSTSSSSAKEGGVPEFPYQSWAAACLVLVLAVSYVSARRRLTRERPGSSRA